MTQDNTAQQPVKVSSEASEKMGISLSTFIPSVAWHSTSRTLLLHCLYPSLPRIQHEALLSSTLVCAHRVVFHSIRSVCGA